MTQAPAAPAASKPVKLPREEDSRNPNHRLAAFFDDGTLELSPRTTAAACSRPWAR